MAVRTTSWTWGFPCRDVKWKWLLRSVLTYISLITQHFSPFNSLLFLERRKNACILGHMATSLSQDPPLPPLHVKLPIPLPFLINAERERERAPLISSRDTAGQEGLPWCGFQLQTIHVAGLLFYFLAISLSYSDELSWACFCFFVFKQYFKKN